MLTPLLLTLALAQSPQAVGTCGVTIIEPIQVQATQEHALEGPTTHTVSVKAVTSTAHQVIAPLLTQEPLSGIRMQHAKHSHDKCNHLHTFRYLRPSPKATLVPILVVVE